jgi:hypothetical protein
MDVSVIIITRVMDSSFSVGTRESFQILDSYIGGTLQNIQKVLSDLIKLNCCKYPWIIERF